MNRTSGDLSTAGIISKITNPCFLSIVMLLTVTFSEVNRFSKLVEWMVFLFIFLIIVPSIYILLRIRSRWKNNSIIDYPMLFLKQHPKDILLLCIICGVPCCLILNILDAPSPVLNTLIVLLITAAVIALVNLYYRASFHLAGVAVLIYLVITTWGLWFLFLMFIVPPAIWAKYRLHDHTIVQMVSGIAIGIALTALTLYLLG